MLKCIGTAAAKRMLTKGESFMKRLALVLLALPLAQSGAWAQAAGTPAAGKAYWERVAPRNTDCRNCHGGTGEGAFGPDLAGRGLSAAQVMRAVRQPWGVMPAFDASQVSAQDAADLAAYFASLPKLTEPGKWRFEVPPNAPPGQATMISMGCGQCHTPAFQGPRNNMGGYGMNFDYFANLVYNHTTAMPAYRAEVGNTATNLDMGNFSRARLSIEQLRQIYFWARDEIGFRPQMAASVGKGDTGPTGVTYPVTIANVGVQGKGLIAEGLTVSLNIPAGNTVVAATGQGYQGVTNNVATWKLGRSAPKDQEKLTVTLSQPLTQAANVRGSLTWAKPAPKTGTDVPVAIAGAPL
jgi:mono/diheme cytochrome c family protein